MIALRIYSSVIPARLNAVGATVKDIMTRLQDIYGEIGECIRFELKVILNELILNAIKHGSKCDCNKVVKVKIGIAAGHYIIVIIQDEGTGFDHNYIANNNRNAFTGDCPEMKETGRGIMLVSNLCSRIRFNLQGNRVVVLKDLIQD